MSRYFFDFRQGSQLTPDKIGLEYASAEAAYLESMEAAREMFADLLADRQDPRNCAFEIRAESGEVLFVVPFLELLESCHDAAPHRKLGQSMQHAMATRARSSRVHQEFHTELERLRQSLREAASLIATAV